MSEPRTCETCPWWSNLTKHVCEGTTADFDSPYPGGVPITEVNPRDVPTYEGQCRAHAPQTRWSLRAETNSSRGPGERSRPPAVWPTTNSTDWCGEHPERRSPPKKPKDPPKDAHMVFPRVGP
jgi:hypothetical protein